MTTPSRAGHASGMAHSALLRLPAPKAAALTGVRSLLPHARIVQHSLRTVAAVPKNRGRAPDNAAPPNICSLPASRTLIPIPATPGGYRVRNALVGKGS